MNKIIKHQQQKNEAVLFQLVNEAGQLKTHGSKVVGYLPINEIPSKGLLVLGDFVKVEIDGDDIYSNNLKEAIYKSIKESSKSNLRPFLKGKLSVISRLRRKGTLQIPKATIERNNKVEIIPSKIINITSKIVVFECITDVKNQCYETREFPIILFEKYDYLKIGLVCNLNITLLPNNSNIEITNPNDSKIEKLFDTSDLFEGLEELNVHYQ